MANAFYSSFFSSGLLAPQQSPAARSQTPRPATPTTPRPGHSTLVPDDTTPTAPATPTDGASLADESQLLPSISVATADDARPRLRRRRSSLAGAASPLATVKSSAPHRQAAASAQRSLRARAGSDASIMTTSSTGAAGPELGPVKKPGIIGRLRSGSLGTALRSRRGLRRSVPSVPAPPPTAPLPALPPLSSSQTPSPLPSIVASPVTPRRPLAYRAQTCDNYALGSSPFSLAGTSPLCYVNDDDEDAFAASLRAGVPSSPGPENAMQVDYPSPVEGGRFDWGGRN